MKKAPPEPRSFNPKTDVDITNKTVDEMRDFWDQLGLVEGSCIFQEDANSGRLHWRRCLVDKRDTREWR